MSKKIAVVLVAGLIGACATLDEPRTAEVQARLDAADLFEALGVPDEGPAARKVGYVAIGGHSTLVSRLNTLRGNVGFGSATVTVKDQDCTSNPPSIVSGQPDEQDRFAQGLAITAAATQIVVSQAASLDGEDIADAIDCLTSQGVHLIVGTFQADATMLTHIATPIADARTAGIRVMFGMGLGAYTGATAPQPAGQTGVFGVGLVQLAKVGGVWTRTAHSSTGASDPKFAAFALPGSGPIYDGTQYVTASNSSAYALGLAAGGFIRLALTVDEPADLDAIDEWFADVTAGSVGTCSPSQNCNAVSGKDGPSGWGLPDLAEFPQFPEG